MKKVWDAEEMVKNHVDEDCIISGMIFNEDDSITANVELHIYLNGKTYTGFESIKVEK